MGYLISIKYTGNSTYLCRCNIVDKTMVVSVMISCAHPETLVHSRKLDPIKVTRYLCC